MEQTSPEQAGQMPSASAAPALPSAVTPPPSVPPPPPAAPAVPIAAVSAPVSTQELLAAPTVREDQVQNAVGFLSHPQVRGSTNTASKRAFLERKGLNAAEIDEAFRRVPEAPPQPAAAPSAPGPPTSAPQPAVYVPQPAPQGQQLAAPSQQPYATASTHPGNQMVAVQPAGPAALVPQVAPTYRWSQVVLGLGAVVAAGWAVHQLVLPRLRSLVESWQAQRREAEEARHKELNSAVASLKGCQEELRTSTQALLEAVNLMREQQRASTVDGILAGRGAPPSGRPAPRDSYYTNGRNDLPYGALASSNPSMNLGADSYAALRAASGYTNAYPPDPPSYTVSYGYGRESGPATAGPTGGDGGGGGSRSIYGAPNAPYGPIRSAAAHPYGGPGAGGGPAQQQQENLPYRVTAPPSPAHSSHSLQTGRPQQQHPAVGGGLGSASGPYGSNDRLYDTTMPGGQGARAGAGAMPVSASPAAAAAAASAPDGRTVPRPPPEQPVYPQSFHEVMEMVQQGITPPNVRTDINDSPPDPTRPLSEPRMAAPLKPWERAAVAAAATSGSVGASASGLQPPGSSGSPYSGGRANGMPYSFDQHASGQSPSAASQPLQLPPTSYGMPSSGAGASGSAAPGGTAGRVSSSGAAGAGGLSVLPPANPLWRPPPPPVRTVVASMPSSPPSTSMTGMGGGGAGEAAQAAAAAAAAPAAAGPPPPPPPPAAPLAPEVPEPMAALAGPPSPSPSQPAFAASATDGPSAFDTPAGSALSAFAPATGSGTAAAVPPPPSVPSPPPVPVPLPPPPPALAAVMGSADAPGGAAADAASSSDSAAPGISRP